MSKLSRSVCLFVIDSLAEGLSKQTPNHRLVHGARYLVKTKLALILKVFSLSLNNPGPLQNSQLLHDTFFRCLLHCISAAHSLC